LQEGQHIFGLALSQQEGRDPSFIAFLQGRKISLWPLWDQANRLAPESW
jgi:hypothetical protein